MKRKIVNHLFFIIFIFFLFSYSFSMSDKSIRIKIPQGKRSISVIFNKGMDSNKNGRQSFILKYKLNNDFIKFLRKGKDNYEITYDEGKESYFVYLNFAINDYKLNFNSSIKKNLYETKLKTQNSNLKNLLNNLYHDGNIIHENGTPLELNEKLKFYITGNRSYNNFIYTVFLYPKISNKWHPDKFLVSGILPLNPSENNKYAQGTTSSELQSVNDTYDNSNERRKVKLDEKGQNREKKEYEFGLRFSDAGKKWLSYDENSKRIREDSKRSKVLIKIEPPEIKIANFFSNEIEFSIKINEMFKSLVDTIFKNITFTQNGEPIKNNQEILTWSLVPLKKSGYFPYKVIIKKRDSADESFVANESSVSQKNKPLQANQPEHRTAQAQKSEISQKVGEKAKHERKSRSEVSKEIKIPIQVEGIAKFDSYQKLTEPMREILRGSIVLVPESKDVVYRYGSPQLKFNHNKVVVNNVKTGELKIQKNDLFEETKIEIKNGRPKGELKLKFKEFKEDKIIFTIKGGKDFNLSDFPEIQKDIRSHLKPAHLPDLVEVKDIKFDDSNVILPFRFIPFKKVTISVGIKGSQFFKDHEYSYTPKTGLFTGINFMDKSNNKKLFPVYDKIKLMLKFLPENSPFPEKEQWLKSFSQHISLVDEHGNKLASSMFDVYDDKLNLPKYLHQFSNLWLSKKDLQFYGFKMNPVSIKKGVKSVKLTIEIERERLTITVKSEEGEIIPGAQKNVKVYYQKKEIRPQGGTYYLLSEPFEYIIQYSDPQYPKAYLDYYKRFSPGRKRGQVQEKVITLSYNKIPFVLKPHIAEGQSQWAAKIPRKYIVTDKHKERVSLSNNSGKLKIVNAPFTVHLLEKDTLGWEIPDQDKFLQPASIKNREYRFAVKRKTVKSELVVNFKGAPPNAETKFSFNALLRNEDVNKTKLSVSHPVKESFTCPKKLEPEEKISFEIGKLKGYNLIVSKSSVNNYTPDGNNWKKGKLKVTFSPKPFLREQRFDVVFKPLPPVRIVFVDISEGGLNRETLYKDLMRYVNKKPESLFMYLTNGLNAYTAENGKCKGLLDQKLYDLQAEVTNFYSDFKKMISKYKNASVRTTRKEEKYFLILSQSSFKTIKRDPDFFIDTLKRLNIRKDQIKIIAEGQSRLGSFEVFNQIKLD